MGTSVSVELWHESAAVGEDLVAAVIDEYRRIDALMSTYIETSEISQVNAGAAASPVKVSAELLLPGARTQQIFVRMAVSRIFETPLRRIRRA